MRFYKHADSILLDEAGDGTFDTTTGSNVWISTRISSTVMLGG